MCYIYQVPKYLSKGIAFILYVFCSCVYVHLCTLQFCPRAQSVYSASNMSKKEPEKTAESKVALIVTPVGGERSPTLHTVCLK